MTASANANPIATDPIANFLSSREHSICKNLHITPSTFIQVSTQLEDECKRRGGLKESEALALASWHNWETGQWSGLWAFLLRFNYVWIRRSRKRGRRAEESSDEEPGGLMPIRAFHRTVKADGTVENHYGQLTEFVRYTPESELHQRDSQKGSGVNGAAPRRQTDRATRDPGAPAAKRSRMGGLEGPRRIQVADDDDLVVEMPDRNMYRLVCHDCNKTRFTNLQGYVNHIRISHNRYFPSHADAVTQLGALVPAEEARERRIKAGAYRETVQRSREAQIRVEIVNRGPRAATQPSHKAQTPTTAGTTATGTGAAAASSSPSRERYVFTRMRKDNVEVVMACPSCGRNDITTMQGYLKHAATHGITNYTVDEAIEKFGIPLSQYQLKGGIKPIPVSKPPAPAMSIAEKLLGKPMGSSQYVRFAPKATPVAQNPQAEFRSFLSAPMDETPKDVQYTRVVNGVLVRFVCPVCKRTAFNSFNNFISHLWDEHHEIMRTDNMHRFTEPVKDPPPLPADSIPSVQQAPRPTSLSGRSIGPQQVPQRTASPKPPRSSVDRSGRPPPAPLDISGLPDVEKLNEEEREMCSSLRMTPEGYLQMRKIFQTECKKNGGLGRRAARQLVKVDVNKSSKVWEYMYSQGLVWPKASDGVGTPPLKGK